MEQHPVNGLEKKPPFNYCDLPVKLGFDMHRGYSLWVARFWVLGSRFWVLGSEVLGSGFQGSQRTEVRRQKSDSKN